MGESIPSETPRMPVSVLSTESTIFEIKLKKIIENGFPEVSFPFTKNPRVLRNNRKEIIKKVEKQ